MPPKNMAESSTTKGVSKDVVTLPTSPGPGFYSQLGSDMVNFHVGTGVNQKHFAVHKKLLQDKATVFDKMFNSGLQESKTLTATLPEDDAKAFAAFVDWLYTGRFLTVTKNVDSQLRSDSPVAEIIKLVILASKYNLREMLDRSVTAFIWRLGILDKHMGINAVRIAYTQCPSGSKFRLFAAKTILYQWTAFPNKDSVDAKINYCSQNIEDIFVKNHDILSDIVQLARDRFWEKEMDPRRLPRCYFHEHEDANDCPYTGTGVETKDGFEA